MAEFASEETVSTGTFYYDEMNMRALTLTVVTTAFFLTACATTQQQEPQVKRISPEELEQLMPKPVPNLTLDEIVSLSKQGMSPEQIIEKIKASNSRYDLTPSEVVRLTKAGVDPKVLDYMHETHENALRENMADEINKREKQRQQELDRLEREYRLRQFHYYDPWWGYWGPGPYWRYGPRFRYYYGW
jgi:hypothetical protein